MMRVLPARGGLAAEDLTEVLTALRSGVPVGLPTETVYGLAAPALQPDACRQIFHCKSRPLSDPLICHIPNPAWVARLTQIPAAIQPQVDTLISTFWPGPLTLVLPRSPIVPDVVTAGQPTVALRQSAHPVFRQIIEALDQPLAAPSANRFGRISPTRIEHVLTELGEVVTLAVDGGPCSHGLESTILSVTLEGGRILRPGPILPEDLARVLPLLPSGLPTNDIDAPMVPGNLASHYAPATPLKIFPFGKFPPPSPRHGILAWQQLPPGPWGATEVLTPEGNPIQAATAFYAALRRLDESRVELILAELPPDLPLGLVLRERLAKAAAAHPASSLS